MRAARHSLAIALALLVTALAVAACKDVGTLPTDTPDPGIPGSGGGTPSASRTVVIEITGFAFRGPAGTDRIEVAAGDTLEFVNLDTAPHTATTDGFDSGRLDLNDRYRTVVTAAGTYDLRCDFHPAMTGTLVVAAGGTGGSGDPGGGAGDPGDGGSGGPGSGDPGDGSSGPGSGDPGDGTSGPGSGATVVVDVRDDVFVGPGGSSRIEVAPGTTVRFVNRGESPHTATSTSAPTGGAAFDSGRMYTGDAFEVTFTTLGTWSFRCDFHDEMTGTIVVTDNPDPGTPPGGGSPGDGGSGSSATVTVTIGDGGFSNGGNVTLELGGTVEWVNASGEEHEIDSTDEPDDAPEIESGDMAPGARFRFTPDRTGTWTYRCKEHREERGMQIVVH